jgi:hypothetical protein
MRAAVAPLTPAAASRSADGPTLLRQHLMPSAIAGASDEGAGWAGSSGRIGPRPVASKSAPPLGGRARGNPQPPRDGAYRLPCSSLVTSSSRRNGSESGILMNVNPGSCSGK